ESCRRTCIVRDKCDDRSILLLGANSIYRIIALKNRDTGTMSQRLHSNLVTASQYAQFYPIALACLYQVRHTQCKLWSQCKQSKRLFLAFTTKYQYIITTPPQVRCFWQGTPVFDRAKPIAHTLNASG